MLHFSESELLGWVAAWFYPLVRVAGLIGTAPILSDGNIPQRVKIALALLVTAAIAPTLGPAPTVTILSLDGLAMIVRQALIGAGMGLGMRLAFFAVQYAGDLAGLQMGLGFAQTFDPQHNQESPVVGNLLTYLASLVFLSLNGHLMMLAAISASFASLPLEGSLLTLDWQALVLSGGIIFSAGLYLALPVVAAVLLATVVLGVMMRSAPQMNLFAVGFPLTLLVGLAAFFLALPALMPMFEHMLLAATGPLLR